MPSPAIASRLGVAAAALLVLTLPLAPAAAGAPSIAGTRAQVVASTCPPSSSCF